MNSERNNTQHIQGDIGTLPRALMRAGRSHRQTGARQKQHLRSGGYISPWL